MAKKYKIRAKNLVNRKDSDNTRRLIDKQVNVFTPAIDNQVCPTKIPSQQDNMVEDDNDSFYDMIAFLTLLEDE